MVFFKNRCCYLLISFLVINSTLTLAQYQPGDVILGNWMDSKKETLVHCFKSNGKYYGRLVWIANVAEPGQPISKADEKHINYLVLKDFEYEDNEWVNGIIHQPKTKKTYTAYLKLINNDTMELVGYKIFRFLSESQIFTRVTINDVETLHLKLPAN